MIHDTQHHQDFTIFALYSVRKIAYFCNYFSAVFMNICTYFIAVSDFLIAEKYTFEVGGKKKKLPR